MNKPIACRWLPVLLLALSSFLPLLHPPVAHGTALEPRQVVKETVDSILALLKDPQLAGNEKKAVRKQRIIEKVEQRFDFREMSQRTLASSWRQISTDQQNAFVKLFTKLLENTYLAKIEQYSNEEILYKAQEIRGKRAVVESSVIHNGVETPLVYRMKNESGQWFVYDVIIEGVSLVSNYRSQFAGVLEKEKFSGLIARLEKKLAEKEE